MLTLYKKHWKLWTYFGGGLAKLLGTVLNGRVGLLNVWRVFWWELRKAFWYASWDGVSAPGGGVLCFTGGRPGREFYKQIFIQIECIHNLIQAWYNIQ